MTSNYDKGADGLPQAVLPGADQLSDDEFLALFPLYRLAGQRAKNRDPNFDYSLSRFDLMNGRNGIPRHVGMKIVFTLLRVTGKYVDMSADEQSFRINERGAKAVLAYAQNRENHK